MAECHDLDPNCSPCKDCPPPPEPVLPRCDIALPDGSFTNATVTVEQGCIIAVAQGRAPQYTPDPCCSGTGSAPSSPSDEPCDCPPGEPGENATIHIGQVFSVAPGEPAQVINVGTDTTAVLDFYLPRGDRGDDAQGSTGVSSSAGGLFIEDGIIVGLPATWPPVQYIIAQASPNNVSFAATPPDPNTGLTTITLNLTQFEADLKQWTTNQINAATAPLQSQIDALQTSLASLQTAVSALQSKVNQCCP